ncbi:MAG TPA: argininosuccinate lyase [Phycisphaerales bacterium]|nr:argininosuccinate lyase [Phycisphaerales bacterium]
MALWGGMFEGKSSSLFRALNDSLPFDRAMVAEDIEGSIAWSRAIQRAGVIDGPEQQRLEAALRELHVLATTQPELLNKAEDEDVHSWVERELVARVGDLGKKLHTGRSRNDQVATDLRLWTVKAVDALIHQLRAAQRSLLAFAEREHGAGTVVPGYTHLQRGQPVMLGHWAMAYVQMLDRDAERLTQSLGRTAVSPLGSGALAGTAYDVDRAALAGDLGLDGGPSLNSLDAVSDRDFVFETLSCAALCSIHLSRLAEDLILYSSSEFGFVQMDDSVTSGSSLMPQKKNPDAAELLRGKSGRILGNLVGLAATLKGLPLAYNKDLQEDKEGLFDTVQHLSMCLAVLPVCFDGIKVNRDRCNAAADDGVIAATDLADYLVRKGVPFRDAHHISGRLVRRALDLKTSLSAMPIAEMKAIEPRIEQDIYPHLTVRAMLAKRNVIGGTAPAQVAKAIEQAKRRLAM